jgi:hypothetical protein
MAKVAGVENWWNGGWQLVGTNEGQIGFIFVAAQLLDRQ